ncbi:hypothetical protein WJX84_001475 [Apatococcus fuscideae]|uniref:BZIP domain-containing protein n=1 Tax=Apatococcus fuscideae TaxID=2026836 RepID=A0AAW1TD30_9CHLO
MSQIGDSLSLDEPENRNDGPGQRERPSGSPQRAAARAKALSEKNRRAQKRYRDRQREKLDAYKCQIDELTTLTKPAAPHHSNPHEEDAYQEIFRVLFELLPEARQSGVFTNDRECGPVQNMSRIWQAAMSRMMKHLVHGAADTDNPAHWELHTFCDTLHNNLMRLSRLYPGFARQIQLGLRSHQPNKCDYTEILGAVKLSSQQSSLVIAALIRLQSELGLLEGQRREAAAALSTAYMDNFGGKIKLTALFMQHHQALGQVDAICSQEQELFLQFMDDFYDALGPIKFSQAQVEAYPKYLDQLAFAAALKDSMPADCPSTPQDINLPLEDIFSCLNAVPFDSAESSAALAELDLLHDPTLVQGLDL